MRFMEASSLRLGDKLMLKSGQHNVRRLTWRNGLVTVNDILVFDADEAVAVLSDSTSTSVPIDREVLWRQAVALQVLLDSAIVE